MPKYTVSWGKTYYASGLVEIEANSSEDAEDIVRDRMGDYEGSMQYDADKDYAEAHEVVDNSKWLNDLWTSKKKEMNLPLKRRTTNG